LVRKPAELVQVKWRLPEHLHAQIEREAKKSGRSLSAEAAHLWGEAFAKRDMSVTIKSTAETIMNKILEDFESGKLEITRKSG
jgi:hypothetical protein